MSFPAVATVATKTARECVRQPIYLIVVGASAALIALSPSFALFSLFENEKLVKDMGMATILLAGLFLAATSASSALSDEIESRTVFQVLSKPVSRTAFVVGKFLGVAATLVAAVYLLSLLLAVTLRVGVLDHGSRVDSFTVAVELGVLALILMIGGAANYFLDRPFTTTATVVALGGFTVCALAVGLLTSEMEVQPLTRGLDMHLLTGCFLLVPAVLILAALAVALSTRLNITATMAILSSFLILGLLSDYLFGRAAAEGNQVARVLYGIIPSLQIFWTADAVTRGVRVPGSYMLMAWLYGLSYSTGLVFLAALLFRDREMS